MTIHSLSLTGSFVFYILLIIFAGSAISLLWRINNFFMIDVPYHGGSITEGVTSLAALCQSSSGSYRWRQRSYGFGLCWPLRETPQGDLIPDLAQNYTLSPDGKLHVDSETPS
jgi:hypothetical protein